MPVSIANKFAQIQTLKKTVDSEAFFSNPHKRDREWNVLGAAHRLLSSTPEEFASLAEESYQPDFMTYLEDGSQWLPIEITEALRPNELRHKKHKEIKETSQPHLLPPPLENPWTPLQTAISNKAKKVGTHYPLDTALIVYFGLWLFDFQDWLVPVASQIIARNAEQPFNHVEAFSRVYVLTSGMDSIVLLNKI